MIPKKIHYCWFGKGKKPDIAIKCITSWKKYCPDYEIVEWNEDNFNINSNDYVREAYENKKFAFVTDYVRLYVLYNYGGIYMDTDVEVIKPLDIFLKHQAFSSFENNDFIPTGIMAAQKGNVWIKELLKDYDNLHFIRNGKMDLTPNTVTITNTTVKKFGLNPNSSYQELADGAVTIYPFDVFCPKSHITNKINITDNTYTIHHFSGSWMSPDELLRKKYKNYFIKKLNPQLGIFVGNVAFGVVHPFKMIKKIITKTKY